MRLYKLSLCAHLLSALILALSTGYNLKTISEFKKQVEWPTEFEGRKLIELDLSPRELQFTKNFPGQIGRFTDGEREVLLRYVNRETRMLHPAADCLRASGYSINPLPMRIDAEEALWGCAKANRRSESLKVCERIYDQAGNSYSDVSAWYWAALLNRTQGPWWAVTTSEVY